MDFKYPHTPHLAWMGVGAPRADKVLSADEAKQFLARPIVVEEKVDGANIGIFLDDQGSLRVKNRGTVLEKGDHPQFQVLWSWLASRQHELQAALGDELMLFGEWCYAVHSVRYCDLPDYFIGFDVYDQKKGRFWSVEKRDGWAAKLGITTPPIIATGRCSLAELERLLSSQKSRFGGEPVEGLYLRQDQDGWLRSRAKLVRPEFVQAIGEHWTRHALEKNQLSGVAR